MVVRWLLTGRSPGAKTAAIATAAVSVARPRNVVAIIGRLVGLLALSGLAVLVWLLDTAAMAIAVVAVLSTQRLTQRLPWAR